MSVLEVTPEYAARCQDFRYYHPHLKIRDRDTKQLVPFQPNDPQIDLYNARCEADAERRAFRALDLKARQVGISTGWQAMTGALVFTRSGRSAGTFAHDDDTTNMLHGMTETMYDELPDVLRPPKKRGLQGKRLVLQFPSGTSQIITKTAGAREVGRGMNFTDVHASEVAFWPDVETTLTALLQAVQDLPGTYVLLESTANGHGGVFYEMCRAAKARDPRWASWCRGESDWEFFFVPWFDDAGYRRAVPAGGLGVLDDEEVVLRRDYDVSDEQLAWRRWQIQNQFGGNLNKFHQEMPAWPEQAFLSSGRRYFDEQRVNGIQIATPKRGELAGSYPAPFRFKPHAEGRFRYWEAPKAGHSYIVAVDPSGELKLAEAEQFPGREKNKTRDPSSIHVIDRSTGRMVAAWHDAKPDLTDVAEEAAKIAKLYSKDKESKAIVAVEANGNGAAVLVALQNLKPTPRLYTHRRYEIVDGIKRWTETLGFQTTVTTRPIILQGLDDVIRDHPDHLPDAELVDELRTFVVNDAGRPEHDAGCHDDRVFSAAIGFEVARLMPQRTQVAA